MSEKLYHFYHFHADGDWLEPASDHFRALQESGLLKALDGLYIGFIGNDTNISRAMDWLNGYNTPYTVVTRVLTGFEQETLDQVQQFAKDNDGHVLYGHTKGAGYPVSISMPWRKSMIWYTIMKWQECIEHLDEGYTTVGSHWYPTGGPEHGGWPFWAGTYWWAKLQDLRLLDKPSRASRYDAEHWIGELQQHMEIKQFDMNPNHISTDYLKYDW